MASYAGMLAAAQLFGMAGADCCIAPRCDVPQAQAQQADEHSTALAGATQLQEQLAELQQQLADTITSFNAEQAALTAAAREGAAAQQAAEAVAAEAQQQLVAARSVLAERIGEAEQQHKRQLADLQAQHQAEASQLHRALAELRENSEAAAATAVADRLAAAESGRIAAEAALSQLADEVGPMCAPNNPQLAIERLGWEPVDIWLYRHCSGGLCVQVISISVQVLSCADTVLPSCVPGNTCAAHHNSACPGLSELRSCLQRAAAPARSGNTRPARLKSLQNWRHKSRHCCWLHLQLLQQCL